MHGERDHLVRVVFPELKERCKKKRVRLVDVDLRWGVSEQDAHDGKALDICLDEIDTCRPFFIGILGHRYGWIPPGQMRSITAEEIYHGVLHDGVPKQIVDLRKLLDEKRDENSLLPEEKDCLARNYNWDAGRSKYLLNQDMPPGEYEIIRKIFQRNSRYSRDRSFFFFRKESLTQKLAGSNPDDFFDLKDQLNLDLLKREIVDSGVSVFDYDDLEVFGQTVLEVVWQKIETGTRGQVETKDWLDQERELHDLFAVDRARGFVGRKNLLERMHTYCIAETNASLLLITGEPGCGKSALMAQFAEEAAHAHPEWLIISHFVGASSYSSDLRLMLRRFCLQLVRAVDPNERIPEELGDLLHLFSVLLNKAAERQRVVLILDAANQLERLNDAQGMKWLPQPLPANLRMIISTLESDTLDALRARHVKPLEEKMTGWSASEVREFVQRYLKEIRHDFPDRKVEISFYEKVSGGNPLYTMVALEELRVFGKFEDLARRIDRLPDELSELFDQVLERIEADFTSSIVRDCMSYLACGRYGMTAEELQTLLKSHAVGVHKLPDMLWARLYRAFGGYLFERSGVIDFFHLQLKEAVGKRYLNEKEERRVAHESIASYFETRWKEPYLRALQELPHQLIKSRDWTRLEQVLTDLEFVESKCSAGLTYELLADYESSGVVRITPGAPVLTARAFQGESGIHCPLCCLAFTITENSLGSLINCPGCQNELKINSFALALEQPPCKQKRKKEIKENISDAQLSGAVADFGEFVRREANTFAGHADLLFQQAANEPENSAPAFAAAKRLEAGPATFPWVRRINKPVRSDSGVLTIIGREDSLQSPAFSPDGSRIVAVSKSLKRRYEAAYPYDQTTLALWDTATGKLINFLQGAYAPFSFSPDGNRIVSAARNSPLQIWDASDGQPLAELNSDMEFYSFLTDVSTCVFSPDATRIYCILRNQKGFGKEGTGFIKAWDCSSGAEVFSMKIDLFSGCSFSPDLQHLLIWNDGGSLSLIDLVNRRIQEIISRSTATATEELFVFGNSFGLFSPDGTHFAFEVKTRRTPDRKELRVFNVFNESEFAGFEGGSEWAYSPDGRFIVSSCPERVDKEWKSYLKFTDVKSGRITGKIEGRFPFCFSHDGKLLAAVADDEQEIKLWNVSLLQEMPVGFEHTNAVSSVIFSPDDRRILSCGHDNTLRLYDVSRLVGEQSGSMLPQVRQCVFSPDGLQVVSGHGDTICEWNAVTGERLSLKQGKGKMQFLPDGTLTFSSDVRKISDGAKIVSPDGTRSAFIKLSLADLANQQSGERVCAIIHQGRTTVCAFSKDSRQFITASAYREDWDQQLMVWDAHTGAKGVVLKGDEWVHHCEFSPDGTHLLSRSRKKTIRFWDLKAGKLIRVLSGTVSAFSPDGSLIVTGGAWSGTLSVLDGSNAQELKRLDGHRAEIAFCRFSPDGEKVISGSFDNSVRIWDVQSGETICIYPNVRIHDATAVDWSFDGTRFVLGTANAGIHLLNLENVSCGPPVVISWSRPNFAIGCPFCRIWSNIESSNPGHRISCPSCSKELNISPRSIDADWRMMSDLWQGRSINEELSPPVLHDLRVSDDMELFEDIQESDDTGSN